MKQEKIWEAYQNNDKLKNLGFPAKKRFYYLADYIGSGKKVLNIGIGNGFLEKLLVEKNCDVSCLDPSESAIENIKKALGLGDKAKSGYSQAIPFDDYGFDVVVMSEVLEHLDTEVLNKTLEEVKRVLKKGGEFIGTVPADELLESSVVVCPDCSKQFHRWGHMQSFSDIRLTNILKQSFNHVDVKRKIFIDFEQLNWKGKVLAILKKIQVYFNIKGSNQNFFFVCQKK